jgi:hypothetical protein
MEKNKKNKNKNKQLHKSVRAAALKRGLQTIEALLLCYSGKSLIAKLMRNECLIVLRIHVLLVFL